MLTRDRLFRFDIRHNWSAAPDQQRMEVDGLRGPTLTYYPGRSINFGPEKYIQPKSLQPFCRNRYNDFDELLADMLVHGYFITDYRRLKGFFCHYNEVLPFVSQGYVVEAYRGQVILVKRDPAVIHGDIWVVDADLVRVLKHRQLIRRDHTVKHGCYRRDVYTQGASTLDTLTDREREILEDRQFNITSGIERTEEFEKEEEDRRVRLNALAAEEVVRQQEHRSPAEQRMSHTARHWFPPIEAPAFKKPRRAQPVSPDTILAYDHCGEPITAREVSAEGRKTLPKGLPADLMPDVPEDCSDEQWEQLMLIEQVKFRRLNGL